MLIRPNAMLIARFLAVLTFSVLASCSKSGDVSQVYEQYGLAPYENINCEELDYIELQLSHNSALNCLLEDVEEKAKFILEKIASDSQEARLELAILEINQKSPSEFDNHQSGGVSSHIITLLDATNSEHLRKRASFALGELNGFSHWRNTEALSNYGFFGIDGLKFRTACIIQKDKLTDELQRIELIKNEFGIDNVLEKEQAQIKNELDKECDDDLSADQLSYASNMFGVKRNVPEAKKWFQISHKLGHPCALARIADMNAYSVRVINVYSNFTPSRSDIKNYTMAAKNGCHLALSRLAEAYSQPGPNQDNLLSYVANQLMSSNLGGDGGMPYASFRNLLENKLSFEGSEVLRIPKYDGFASLDSLSKNQFEKAPGIIEACKSDWMKCQLFAAAQ